MTVYDDCFDLHDFDPGDLALTGPNEFSEGQLCVPPDSLEDLKWEWFPCFSDEHMALNQSSFSGASDQPRTHELLGKTKQRKNGTVNGNWVGICDGAVHGFTKKKTRTKKKKARRSMVVIGRKKCSHCKTEETPQWRNGPDGPKTLCNACGVRFKSGRLLPEYRPAASPTFDEWRHSNYHRKIMQKRGSDC